MHPGQGVERFLQNPASDPDTAHDGRPASAEPWGLGLEGTSPSVLPPHAALSVRPAPRYFLQPRDNGSKSLKPGDLGSLRLNVVYTEDHVFSSDYYCPLRDLLLKSADVEVPVPAAPWATC